VELPGLVKSGGSPSMPPSGAPVLGMLIMSVVRSRMREIQQMSDGGLALPAT
jgi:hypothetical protein